MSLLADSLADRVAEIIPRYNMLSRGDRIGVAVSGGADSVVLLHILNRLSQQLQIRLAVLHVNHGLRGAESDADEEFVRALAESIRAEFFVCRAEPGTGNLEQAARDARREFFKSSIREHALDRVALGHTRSDQAETVLFRFLRGSGLAGLAGMRPVTSEGFIRPLLGVSREEVRAWAKAEGITWREDSSNNQLNFARNRLRLKILPALNEEFGRNLETVLTRTADLARTEEDYWFQFLEPIYHQIAKPTHLGSILDVPSLTALHLSVQRRLIRRVLMNGRGDLRSINIEHVDAVLSTCRTTEGHARVMIPGVDALRSYEKLLLMKPGEFSASPRHYSLELELGKVCELPFRAGTIYANWAEPGCQSCANFKEDQWLNAEIADLVVAPSLLVRNWEPGDELHRPGHERAEKIKSLFQEQKILLWERRHWPVVLSGQEIVWARQFGRAAKFGGSGRSSPVLRLCYRPESS